MMPAGLRALDRKLIRDLWEMKGQSLAIAAVIAAGVTMFVTYLSNFDSLQRSRTAYFERARLADVFASLERVGEMERRSFTPAPSMAFCGSIIWDIFRRLFMSCR